MQERRQKLLQEKAALWQLPRAPKVRNVLQHRASAVPLLTPTLLWSQSWPSWTQPPQGSTSPARRQGWSQRARGGGGADVRECGQRSPPRRAGCKGGSLVPCAPQRRQLHHHRRGRVRGGKEGRGPRPVARTLPEYQAQARAGPPPPLPSATRPPGLIPVPQPPRPQSSGGSLWVRCHSCILVLLLLWRRCLHTAQRLQSRGALTVVAQQPRACAPPSAGASVGAHSSTY